jgi:hypothetical protein
MCFLPQLLSDHEIHLSVPGIMFHYTRLVLLRKQVRMVILSFCLFVCLLGLIWNSNSPDFYLPSSWDYSIHHVCPTLLFNKIDYREIMTMIETSIVKC